MNQKYTSTDRLRVTERVLDYSREHLSKGNAQKAEDQPLQIPAEARKEDFPK